MYYWAVLPRDRREWIPLNRQSVAGLAVKLHKVVDPAGADRSGERRASVELQPTFRWTPAEGARRYRLQVADDDKFGSLLDDVVTDSTAYTGNTSYPADTVLYWRVRADGGLVSWSGRRSHLPPEALLAQVLSLANPGSGRGNPSLGLVYH